MVEQQRRRCLLALALLTLASELLSCRSRCWGGSVTDWEPGTPQLSSLSVH